MKTTKKYLFTVIVLLCSISANAYDFEVDGIKYNILSRSELTCEVTGNGYSGDFVIPATVTSGTCTYNVVRIGYNAFAGDQITSVVIPEGVTNIAERAFGSCKKLKNVVLPQSLIILEGNSTSSQGPFSYCTCLKSIVIPQNVKFIGQAAFQHCSNLMEVFILGNPEFMGMVFYYCHSALEIYYPSDMITLEGKTLKYGDTHNISYTNNLKAYTATLQDYVLESDAGTHTTNLTFSYSGDVSFDIDIPYTYTINKAPLNMTINNAERIYGETNPTFTYSLTGFVNNENESVFEAPIALSTTANEKSNTGNYPIKAEASAKNYDFSINEGTLTVKKAPLIVKANDKSRIYGDENPQFDVCYTGLKNGETVPAFTSELNITTDAVKRSDAGVYDITVSGGVANNYEFTEYQSGVLTVTQAPLTINVQNAVRKYGDNNPTFLFTCSGFKNNDTEESLQTMPVVTTSASPVSEVGTYDITADSAEAKNYTFIYEKGTLTIEKAPLTIRANDMTRVYGEENPVFTYTYTGFKNGEKEDVLSVLPSATSADKTSNAGTYNIIPSDASSKNYAITYENGKLTITKAHLTVVAMDNSRMYGEENPEIELTFDGFRNNDDNSCITTMPKVKTEANVSSPVGVYALIPEGGVATNYDFTEYIPGKLTIGKAALTLVANNAEKLYFEENPVFTFRGEGFRNNDTEEILSVVPNYTCDATKISNAGEYEITPQGASAENYDITYKSGKLTVNKRKLEVVVTNKTRMYNEENPEFTLTYKGFVNNESEAVFTKQPVVTCEAERTTDVGVYQIVVSGAEANNYQFDYKNGTLSIEKATQEIIWEQDLSAIELGTQLELTAEATSGLMIEYDIAENDIASIYEANGRVYLDCLRCGSVTIKALQRGNHNYYEALRINKTLVITNPTGIDAVSVNELVDVYSMQGVMVKQQVVRSELKNELPKGIYIIKGKKVIIR